MSISAEVEEIASEAAVACQQVIDHIATQLVGLEEVVRMSIAAVISRGHVLLEGVPGTAKTTLCRNLAAVLDLDYHRIQFTPDLLPTDVTGTKIFDQKSGDFSLQKGPVFCQFLLADELNRAPARTQSALLEAMQECQVTIEGETLDLPQPFVVMATQNPVEQEGVYRLPEAQLDRFLFRLTVGYPDRVGEIDLLELQEAPADTLRAVWNTEMIIRLQQAVDRVYGSRELKEYVVDLARASREHPDILLGASPRAAIFLQKASRARALLRGDSYFTHEDVQAVMRPVLAHRLIIRPESELSGRLMDDVISEIIAAVPVRSE
ncbi:MAG: MoxR family ATPase [Pirellulaceae bacterium]